MKLIGNIYKLVGRLSAILLIGVLSSLVGCASMSLDDHREAVKPKTITVDEFKSLKRAPRSFQKHFKVGLSYFTKDNRTELDLQTIFRLQVLRLIRHGDSLEITGWPLFILV